MTIIIETFPVGMLQCNCSVVGDTESGQALVIDPGGDVPRITEVLDRHGLTPTHILHTHAHIDHVGGTSELKGSRGGDARLHRGDEWLIDNLAVQGQMIGLRDPDPVTIDTWLEHGDRFTLAGTSLEVIHTPGHSPGSCSFVLADGDRPIVFAGDTLFSGSIGRTDLWGGDTEQIMQSLRGPLMSLDDETQVVCGHGPSTTIGHERRANPFLTGRYRL